MIETKIKAKYRVLGLMSGTSLDGLDMALVDFTLSEDKWSFEVVKTVVVTYSEDLKMKLSHCINMEAAMLSELDVELGNFFGDQILLHFGQEQEIDFVSSHGHTIFHQPDKGLTLQIGNAKRINHICHLPVIADFRSQDVANGGNGAPLVPIGDQLLFGNYDTFLNLGGIANCSYYNKEQMVAFDLLPFNMAFNSLAQKLGHLFDHNGDLSQSGNLSNGLRKELSNIKFYNALPPKSLGFEDYTSLWQPIIEKFEGPVIDAMHTYALHAADIIAQALNEVSQDKSSLLVTGGGAYHRFFIELLRKKYFGQVYVPENNLIEFKEAIIFAFLGVLRARNEVNCLSSVTGAAESSSSGVMVGF